MPPSEFVTVRPARDAEGRPRWVPRGLGVLLQRRLGDEDEENGPVGAIAAEGESLRRDSYIRSLLRSGDVVEVEVEVEALAETDTESTPAAATRPTKARRRKSKAKPQSTEQSEHEES